MCYQPCTIRSGHIQNYVTVGSASYDGKESATAADERLLLRKRLPVVSLVHMGSCQSDQKLSFPLRSSAAN